MDSFGPIDNSQIKHRPSQPFLTKKGLEMQELRKKEAIEVIEVSNSEANNPPNPSSENSIDVTA